MTEYGYADEPGRWDHWPSGFLFTWPNEEQAEGVLVLEVGDILLPFKSYARERITLEIEQGFVTRIHGGFEAEYLREYMKYFDDPEVYGISHIGWGLQPRAQWTAMGLHDKNDGMCMDARAFYGNFLFSTGPNTEVGGTRKRLAIWTSRCAAATFVSMGKRWWRTGKWWRRRRRACAGRNRCCQRRGFVLFSWIP